jgi:hypothetical protein
VQEGDDIMRLGGTIKARTATRVVDDSDGSFVIEGAINNAYRCPTPHQPLFHRNQLSSFQFVIFFLEFQNLGNFLSMAKRHQALVVSSVGPAALQGRVLEGACDNERVFDKTGKTRTSWWMSESSFT